MSPKGGIKPHNRFSVQSKRSEVLFVDYMAEHLTPRGRAGIIVPEGIIFQSQTAYTQLRKMLVDEYLIAVVSLPAGVFNPYSGVKTSILLLDRTLGRQTEAIAFFKIENDGFGLGAQRREIEKNDLPRARAEITEYLRRLRARESVEDYSPTLGIIVPKERIGANGEYNLSGERYRDARVSESKFPSVVLGELCELVRGVVYSKEDEVAEGGVQVLRANNINKDRHDLILDDIKRVSPQAEFSSDKKLRKADIFICLASGSKDHIGKVALIKNDTDYFFGGFMGAIRVRPDRLHPGYLLRQLTASTFNDFLREQISGASIHNLGSALLYRFAIPLPPLDVQREIAAEVEGYEKVINGAHAVLDNYCPHIPVHPDWPMSKLGEVAEINPKRSEVAGLSSDTLVSFVPMAALSEHSMTFQPMESRPLSEVGTSYTYFRDNDVLMAKVTPCFENGKAGIARNLSNGIGFGSSEFFVIRCSDRLLPEWAYFAVANARFRVTASEKMTGTGGLQRVPRSVLEEHTIPLPPLATQRGIVAEIEAEQSLVAANRELIERMEKRIQATLARVWGESEPALSRA
jgi:type I restriction enzyme M protein